MNVLSPAKRSQHANTTYRSIVGRNMLRAFGHRAAMCCDMLGIVGYCWLKFENGVKFEPTTPNMSQQGGQMHTTCCAQQCCDMLRWHVAIRRLAGALITNETSPKQSVHLEVKRSLPVLPC